MHTPTPMPATPNNRPRNLGIHSAAFGFLPAFRDGLSGETHLCVNVDSSLSPIHLLDGLPEQWVSERDAGGRAVALKEGIIAGFVRGERCFSHLDVTERRFTDA